MLGYEYNAEAEVRVINDESRREGKTEVAKSLLQDGDSVERVVKVTGLSREDVERLVRN